MVLKLDYFLGRKQDIHTLYIETQTWGSITNINTILQQCHFFPVVTLFWNQRVPNFYYLVNYSILKTCAISVFQFLFRRTRYPWQFLIKVWTPVKDLLSFIISKSTPSLNIAVWDKRIFCLYHKKLRFQNHRVSSMSHRSQHEMVCE